jgi:hypothetical protein
MDTKRSRAARAGAAESTNFTCVACNKGSYRKAVIDGWSSAVCQCNVPALFALFYFYFNHFSNYTHNFKTRKWDSLQKRAPLAEAEAAYLNSSSCALSYGGSGGGRISCSVGCLDVFQPTSTHCWTKLVAQGFNRWGDTSAFVLPHVICNSKIQANLK